MIRGLRPPGRRPAAASLLGRAAILAVLLGAACQPRAALPGGGASPSPGPGAAQALARADDDFFSGRYGAAETAYRGLAEQGDAHARAHLALLLTYESRFEDAVAEARQAVSARRDSVTLARLTRALDWSDEIPAALAAGAAAVQAAPVDPVAHDYYAEALSDAGRYAEAEAQLVLGERQALTPYQVAEAAREWSNYYRDRGQPDDELNYVEIALRYEPGFPERSVELAREYYGTLPARTADARNALRRALDGHAEEYAVILSAADAAFLGKDVTTGERYYRQALAVEPGGPAAAVGLAEILVAVKRDPSGAHDALLDSLRRHPDSSAVYQYLSELDALVLKRNARAELAPIAPQAPAALGAERASAYGSVDAYRGQVALGALHPNAALEQAALAHAYYYLFNFGQASLNGLGVHSEDRSLPGFTGVNSAERDRHFGYQGYQSSEVINHTFTAEAAVEVWADSVYHRYPLLGRESADLGYGEAQVGSLSINVLDLGVGPPATGAPLVYPAAGQADVPGAFTGNEIPDPAPTAQYPIGYPITVQAGGADTIVLGIVSVSGPGGAPLRLYLLNSGSQDLGSNELAILPRSPLKPATTYTVTVIGKLDGRSWSKTWTFTTAA